MPLSRQTLTEELVRDLGEDADAVAGLAVGVAAGPVLQVLHDRQGVVHGLAAAHAFDIDTAADPAVVVLEGRLVQRGGRGGFLCVKHSCAS